ncbi:MULTISPECIES: MFS transporter [Nocardia]|uniref:MFS transporter n=1 Tax=Nocardia implantans TaxID=3108168 RepID=A0ABU6B430_9NOCA|nr:MULTISPECIES: MFS transporter [unclassified Nocardia]MBF6196254.1 MFS transporter [Nocardia beijingensis]MEA3527782.1 MFS transporter [Nocardia sp. CDC192]MEB3514512.1 MFS transporter [Nocardia sp. CDC186]
MNFSTTSASVDRGRILVPILCWAALLSDGYDLFVYGATLPVLIGHDPWQVTAGAAGFVGSVALIGVLLGSLTAGTLTDILGRRRLFLACLALFATATLVTALAPSFLVFAATRLVAGLGIGGLMPTAIAMAAEFAAPRYRSRVLGMVLTGPAFGGVLASTAALALLEDAGFRPVYALGALPLVTLLPVAYFLLPESHAFASPERGAETKRPGGLANSPAARLFDGGMARATAGIWFVATCSMLTMFGVTTWLPQIMRKAGYPIGSSVTFLLVYSAGAIIGTLLAAALAERFGPKPLVLTGFTMAAVALALLGTHPPKLALMLLVAVAGFGGLGTQNMLNDHIASFYPPSLRATGLGWALGIGRVGAIAGPTYGAAFVAGAAAVAVSSMAFAVPALAGGLLMAALPRRPRAATAMDYDAASVPATH